MILDSKGLKGLIQQTTTLVLVLHRLVPLTRSAYCQSPLPGVRGGRGRNEYRVLRVWVVVGVGV
jgi:hypothetical protein